MRSPFRQRSKEFAYYWGTVCAWLLLISALSTDPFSAQNTHRYIDPILRWLFPELSPAGFAVAHTIIRKSGHFTEFFILGLLVFWALRRGRQPAWQWSWCVQAVAFCCGWALLDELHQSFVLTRTASLADSAIDSLGAAASQVLIWFRRTFPRLRSPNAGTSAPSLPDRQSSA